MWLLAWSNSTSDMKLCVDLMDATTTGAKSSTVIEGEWRSCSAIFWLDQGHQVFTIRQKGFEHPFYSLAPNKKRHVPAVLF